MKLILPILCVCLLASSLIADEKTEPLAPVVAKALKEGVDANLNAGFATVLGISKAGVPLKRLKSETNGVTNTFNVSLEDKKTVIITVREKQMSTFYLTDASGKLKRAVVNDGAVKSGGLTNVPVASAEEAFQKKVSFWKMSSP